MDPKELEIMEQLIERQEQIGAQIEAVIRNFKKDSADRKTPTYYQQRIEKIKNLAAEFIKNDECLEDLDSNHKTSEYFTKNYAIIIRNLVDQYVEVFSKAIKNVTTQSENETSKKTQQNNEDTVNSSITKLIRRQNAMISSLKRLIQATVPEDAAAPSLKAKEKLWEQIQELHFAIAENSEHPAAIGYDMDEFIALEVKIMQNFASLAQKNDRMKNNSAPASSNIPLPKINIPKFNGDYAQWPTFYDLFQKVIHEQSISSVQKMWYLKTNLTGEAERLIRHLALTDNNYDTAWSILKDRFNNKRILTASIIQQIVEHPNITSEAISIKGFHDIIQENLAALKNLGIKVDYWDTLLLQIIVKKLDRHTHILYESSISNPTELQTIANFLLSLQQRFQALELMGNKDKAKQKQSKEYNKATSSVATSDLCKLCNEKGHPIYYCNKFKNMTPAERLNWVQSKGLCVKCFKSDHKAKSCQLRSCKKCNKVHNTLLHLERRKETQQPTPETKSATTSVLSFPEPDKELAPVVVTAASDRKHTKENTKLQNYVLLATAKVRIIANNGQSCEARAILDAGSQINLITDRVIKRLSLSTKKTQLEIEGVGLRNGHSTARVNVNLQARIGNFATRFEAFVLPHIISPQPSRDLDVKSWKIPKNIELADPEFFKSEKIDLLIGAEFYHHFMRPEQIQIGHNMPLLQRTALGWIVIGKTEINSEIKATCAIFTEEVRLSNVMEKFWEIEEFGNERKVMTTAEIERETHFSNTVSRDDEGRFVVRLPFSNSATALGESRYYAQKRLESLENRFKRNPLLKTEYIKFMDEYEALGHMEKISKKDIPATNYFIPHHCVQKPDSSTTKLRVVFDAAAKTSSGLSLNDILRKGPTVQSELVSILLRFRTHRFVFTADIEKMYRQIRIHHDDTAQQLIVWRRDSSEDVRFYRLNTLTYGTTSAPYLATKCLQHLATINLAKYPLGAPEIHDNFYVDDFLSGANDISTAKEIQRQTTTLLREAGFKLRKWCANHAQLLADIPSQDQEINLDLDNDSKHTIKTLGLIWLPRSDELCGRASISETDTLTKRSVLSDIARIFDPIGIFGPITVKAKMFMQQLWDLKLSWDQELPMVLQHEWTQFRNNLMSLNNLKTYRHIYNKQVPENVQIHTFVDASEKAYGAAIYIRATYKDKTITNRLLCAKSKVAPRKTLTIPRLELCAAAMGAELTRRVRHDLKYTNVPTFLWSDSTIVRSWIQSQSSTLHNFVANRISRIQRITCTDQWHHISSKDNPADILSRGVSPEKLDAGSMWFCGPLFLYGNKEWWLQPEPIVPQVDNDIERRARRVVAIAHNGNTLEKLVSKIEHRNSFLFLQNVVGYLRRPFVRPRPVNIALSPIETKSALMIIVKAMQTTEFEREINDLKKYKAVGNSSKLSTLTPFIDDQGLVRVGGRLEAATIPYDAKHPMLLPYNDPIVKLLFKAKHEEHNHCGPQTLLSIVRQNFWPIKGKLTARNIVHSCTRCSKAKPMLMHQIMGNLPTDRVTMYRPFLKTGVDYCGPFWIHYKIRGKKPTKAYLAIFCCFSTKAVHLELVTDLTTSAFIGALTRFVIRRGRCEVIYSDNATNFLGAKNQLQELTEAIFSKDSQETIIRESSKKGMEFKFIPPRAPHFGGLWEAAVKSAKHLLLRSVSTASLTYEELETVIVGIEAILNSRPITPMSSDPNDLAALTPGHFLIGEPLTALPEAHKQFEKISSLTRWDLVSKLKYEFWKRWSREYLNELQQRNKWKNEAENLKEGDIVILKADNLPSMKWPLGRVQKVYKGKDDRVRVVDIKTATGVSKRPIHLLAPLPTKTVPQVLPTGVPANESEPNGEEQPQNSIVVSIPLSRIRRADSGNTEGTRNKNRRIHPGIMFTIVALFFLPLALYSPILQHKFPNEPGLYFEGIGNINRIVGDWKIITYFDLNPIRAQMENFRNGTAILEELCPRLHQQTMCRQLVNKFKGINIELRSEENLMRRRIARGALDIVGNIANKLFGVLDSEYAENLSKTIHQLNSNDDLLYNMIRNQTSVMDSTLNIVTKVTEAIDIKLTNLQQEIDNMTMEMANVASHVDVLELYTSITTQLSLMTTELERIEEAIFSVLTDARHGKISPLLISPQQLQQEIIKIKGHLPKSLHLPFNQNDALHLYSLMSSQSGISSHHVVFVIKLPLTGNEEFELFHLIPIPATINDSMVVLHPETLFLAVTSHRDKYFALTRRELQACFPIKQSTNNLLCSDKPSTYRQGADAYSCEINMLKNKTDKNCIIMKHQSEVIWTPLEHSNQWIFGSKHLTQLTAVCNGDTEVLEMQGSSLLTLQSDCVLKHPTVTIQTHRTYKNIVYKPYISFGEFGSLNKSTSRLIIHGSPLDLKRELEQLKELHKDIDIIELPRKLAADSIHHHITSYSALLLIIGTLIWLTWKCRSKLTSFRQPSMNQLTMGSTPAPRFSIDPELAT